MSRRYLSLWMPRFTCDWLDRRQPGLRLRPVVITAKEQGGLVVTGCNHAALRIGVKAGMKLTDARALEPSLTMFEHDAERDQRALDALAEWCERYTPLVALEGAGSLFLDITGCAHLFGGEAALVQRLLAGLRRIGYESYAAVADTPGTAWAVARHAAGFERAGIVVKTGEQDAAMAGLPVAALRLDANTEIVLQRLGLRRIGELYPVARPALDKRFGKLLLIRLDQALGNVPEPISPRQTPARYALRELFVEPISTLEAIAGSVTRLVESLCTSLREDGRGVRAAELLWWRVDGEVGRITIGTSVGSHASKHLLRLLMERLGTIEPGFGIEAMALHATRTQQVLATQTAMEQQDSPADLSTLVDRLANRFGPENVTRFAPQEGWLPERATGSVPAFAKIKARPWPADRVRPLRLLPQPEPVEVVVMLPDQPPVLLRWKGSPRRVVKSDGPERIGAEWWRRDELERDYYRVEDEDGRRYWLYRTGSYGGEEPPRWYLHGLFA